MADNVPLAGVVGWPVGHSKSPTVHSHWLKSLNKSGHYIPLPVAPESFEVAIQVLPKLGFVGVNVTIPHKEIAFSAATEVSSTAKRIGAANTLTFLEGGGYFADNTDGFGFSENLRAAVPQLQFEGSTAAIFGAGGASRSVIDALLQRGFSEVRLMNRTRARAETIANEFGNRVKVFEWKKTEQFLEGANLVVNTTSLGMAGQPPFDLDLRSLAHGSVATDIVYAPLDTSFLQAARSVGAHTVDGLGMLLWQAVPGFIRWFGGSPGVTQDLRKEVLSV